MAELSTGQIVASKYKVLKRLGAGGFGAVFLVEHLHLAGQTYALKVLHPHFAADANRRERFLREVKVAMQLVHPNIVTIRDFAVSPDLVYYTMDYVPGRTLSAVLEEEHAIAQDRALRWARQVLRALGAAHELGIVHRDMKPDNVILEVSADRRRETAKVLDFGIAKVQAETATGLTGMGSILGTPMYLSPEQARGKGPVDHRSDVYSLGVVLYHLLAGRPPFISESPIGYVFQHQMDPPPPFRESAPGKEIGPAVEALVLRALEKDPDGRFHTAEDMVAAIDAALGGGTTPTGSTGAVRGTGTGTGTGAGAGAGTGSGTGRGRGTASGSGAAPVGPASDTLREHEIARALGVDWSRPLEGQVVEKYRLVSRLGEGGFGAVCVGEHVHLGKRVAVKLLRPELGGDDAFVQRFRREARLASTLSHPAIVEINDYGEVPGACYMVMELLAGRTLEETIVAEGPLRLEGVVAFARPVLQALAFAHGRGVVHRDLKPANIFLLHDGRAKVLDFGIAKIVEGAPDDAFGAGGAAGRPITAPGVVLGTAAYLSPEQARGSPLDWRSDLYSFGAIIFEALTGRPPFASPDARLLLRAHVEQPPPRLAEARPGVQFPPALEAVVARLLAKRPDDRFAHALETLDALEDAVASAGRAGPPPRTTAFPAIGAGAGGPGSVAGPSPISSPSVPALPVPPPMGFKTPPPPEVRPARASTPSFRAPTGPHTPTGIQPVAAAGLERARVDADLPGSWPARRTFFLYAAPSLAFGRTKPAAGQPQSVLVLRALPCRSQAQDPENWARTLEISSIHGELVARPDGVCLVDRSSRGTSVDGQPAPRGEPLRLPERFRLELARGALALAGRVFGRDPGGVRPQALRLDRVDNAPEHGYVWVVEEALAAPGEDAAVPLPPGARPFRIVNEAGRLAAVLADGRRTPLAVGTDLGVPGLSAVRGFDPADTCAVEDYYLT